MPAANQFTDPAYLTRDPREEMIGASANQGYRPINLDSQKVGATETMARRGALSLPQYQAMQRNGPYGQAMTAGQSAAPQPRTQTFSQFYGSPDEGAAAQDDQRFQSYGQELESRTKGKRTPRDIEAMGLEAKRLQDEQSVAASRALQARGFAPASALGLSYQNLVDRQVAELMTRRQAEQEQQARTQYSDWLAQSETRRRAKIQEQREQERLELERQNQLFQQREARRNRPLKWIEALGGLF